MRLYLDSSQDMIFFLHRISFLITFLLPDRTKESDCIMGQGQE